MADINVRQYVVDKLKPLLPTTWVWYAYQDQLDNLQMTTVMLGLESIERNQANPQGSRLVTFVLTVIEPKTGVPAREDSLEDSVIDLLNAIDDIPELVWTRADKGLTNGSRNIGFDIALTITIDKE